MTQIAFVIRDDGDTKPGGDIDLTKNYAALLADHFAITITTFAKFDPATFAKVVLFNLDDPFQNFLAAKKCCAAGVPYLIYTLHHKARAVENFLRGGSFGLQRLVSVFAGFDYLRYETLMGGLRIVRAGRARQLAAYRPVRHMTRFILKHAAQVIVSCDSEAGAIGNDFGPVEFHHCVIPHRLPDVSAAGPSLDCAPYVLCAGRIEPRKNQLVLASLAARYPNIPFVFVGKKNARHKHYLEKFDAICQNNANILWREQVAFPELLDLIGSARIYVNVSWLEVFSLIDLMALLMNTPALLSTGSYLAELAGDDTVTGAQFTDPAETTRIGQLLEALWDAPPVPSHFRAGESWSDSVIAAAWTHLLRAETR